MGGEVSDGLDDRNVSGGSGPGRGGDVQPEPSTGAEPPRRPVIERVGMAGIALVMTLLFGAVSVASWVGGEPFLTVMAGIGALMTAWAGANTLFRG
jgi:hypothetical protein